ncbi:Uncharacterised protein [Mycobacteroides abscessus subsp. abscessus]|uniref:hypothetical protein n=1 Tax=Mycobacteroides abscessus TaxID=36809 RepID=UPI00092BA70D|nr:hypothetical protein [Mycobacteroides abscessus]SHS12008.1 Uncharacterised protein [Mycobacteroides abscessus subsp. abscessus]SHS12192.1 Uncharacterised protein [Mycobacteroides abscessus subsp. abscessus]SHT22540.1 Uncharacterised protein [Mycobacteroides abscessus subsp. abscessus]SHW58819.1 Uncharacterised protein [Mycobacteroides abscessus subsp. abscessus]SIB53839.1 Uncharacterised protein [Mycobacteroides abscessus subsp. abscessus]
MTDPAVEAAQRAWGDRRGSKIAWKVGIAAAREMAKSIRKLHRPMTPSELADAGLSPDWRKCVECSSGYYWRDFPCATAEHIYTTEELER